MATAQLLKLTDGVDDKVTRIGDEVKGVGDKVKDIGDTVRMVHKGVRYLIYSYLFLCKCLHDKMGKKRKQWCNRQQKMRLQLCNSWQTMLPK